MSNIRKTLPRIVAMANQLEADIQARELKPGDHYYSTQDASRFLGVAGVVANRALQLLEKRNVIVRKQRVGAVISKPLTNGKTGISRVHFLVHEKYLQAEGVGNDGILLGLQEEHPDAEVRHCFLSPGQEETQVEELVNNAIAEGGTDAFVLVRAPFAVQKIISDSSLPAVIYGSRYPGIIRIPQLERDHGETVRQISRHLRSRNRKNVVFISRDQVFPGDHIVLDALNASDVRPVFRFLPSENECIAATIDLFWKQGLSPDAFICMTARHADCVAEILKNRKIVPGKEVDLIVLSYYIKLGQKARFNYIANDLEPEQTGRRIGQLLARQFSGECVSDESVPVRFMYV